MANYQVNGAVSTTTSTRKNRGVAIQVGSSAVMTDVAIGAAAAMSQGATVVENVSGVRKAVTAGRLAKTVAGEYVIPQVTTTLAGVANTSLRSPSADFGDRQAIHKKLHYRVRKVATAIRAGYWNIYTGVWSTPPATADDINYMPVANDSAANPTRAIPGELVYTDGSANPIQADYKPVTGG